MRCGWQGGLRISGCGSVPQFQQMKANLGRVRDLEAWQFGQDSEDQRHEAQGLAEVVRLGLTGMIAVGRVAQAQDHE